MFTESDITSVVPVALLTPIPRGHQIFAAAKRGDFNAVFLLVTENAINPHSVDHGTGLTVLDLLDGACTSNRPATLDDFLRLHRSIDPKKWAAEFKAIKVSAPRQPLIVLASSLPPPPLVDLMHAAPTAYDNDAMFAAIEQERWEQVLKMLTGKTADPNAVNQEGFTPIHLFVKHAPQEFIPRLIALGADPNKVRDNITSAKPEEATTALGVACDEYVRQGESNWFDVYDDSLIKLLFQHGASPIQPCNGLGQTLLHIAAANGCGDLLDMAFPKFSDPNLTDANGNSPIHLAIQAKQYRTCLQLAKGGVNLNLLDSKGQAPLHYTAFINRENHWGRELEGSNYDDDRALNFINDLFKCGADINLPNDQGETLAHIIYRQGRESLLFAILSNFKPNLNQAHPITDPLLLQFIKSKKTINAIRLLKEYGADPSIQNKDADNALIAAAKVNDQHLLDVLVKDYKMDSNQRDKNGWTILHHLAQKGEFFAVIARVSDYGANPFLQIERDGRMCSALDLLEHSATPIPDWYPKIKEELLRKQQGL